MTIIVITGANKGLGRECARRLVAAGHIVYTGARDEQRGRTTAAELGTRHLSLDVTSDASVEAAAKLLREEVGHIDVLVNNAGIAGAANVVDLTADQLREVYETNVFGVVRVTNVLMPLLEESESPVIVNVSSSLGSMGRATDAAHSESAMPTAAYPSSKAALNMLTLKYAAALPRFRVNAVTPGFTATDLNRGRGIKTVEEGAEIIVRMALVDAGGPTGQFLDDAGTVVW